MPEWLVRVQTRARPSGTAVNNPEQALSMVGSGGQGVGGLFGVVC